ncbi:hypothetical protein L6Q79_03880 [bacterium]|nr:hypothetical protein [bacterium]NUN44320.1 hypothetical protein [bacterium]
MNQLSALLFQSWYASDNDEKFHFRLFEFFVLSGSIYYAWSWADYIRQISDNIHPLGIAQHVPIDFMYGNMIPHLFAIVITTLAFLIFLGRAHRYAHAIILVLLHLLLVARDAMGEIGHSANFIGLSVLALAVAYASCGQDGERRRMALGLTVFFIGLGYVSAALCKLIATGVFWPDGMHLALWIAEKKIDTIARTGIYEANPLQQMVLTHHSAGTLMLGFGLTAELLGFLIWWKRFRPYITLLLVAMHTGISLTMNIRFDSFILQLLILGLPWPIWKNKILDYISKVSGSRKILNKNASV